jgi:hypothetical protein
MWVGRACESVWVAWGLEMVFWVGAPMCTCTSVGVCIVCVDCQDKWEVSVDVCLYVYLWVHRCVMHVCARAHMYVDV